jgi:SAM-dependent methyltransferase
MNDPTGPVEEGRTHSYRMEGLDADAELARLAAQVRLVRGMESDFLDRVGLAPHHVLLDLGCGPGFFSAWARRERVPAGRVIGVDVDPKLLDIARGHGSGAEFLLGSAVRIPLPDACVDVAYARFLFQHLDRPLDALAELRRVTRPGGVVALVDTDDGGLVVHPAPPCLGELLEASRIAQAARGGDRLVGRKLKSLLVEAGLGDTRVQVYPFTSEEVGAAAFVDVALGFKLGAVGEHLAADARAALAAALPALGRDPGFFGHAVGYGAWGRVPA